MILQAENIHKSFLKATNNKKLEVLKGISFSLIENKITIIEGASGAGKSTLLHILGGLDVPDSGRVIIKDTDIFSLDDQSLSRFRNQNIGFVFQFHHLLPEFTAVENVAIPMMIAEVSKTKAMQKAKELLSLVGLNNRHDHKPSELSGGEQQKVAIARALANNPSIIFADEPTGNLDSTNSEVIHKLFIELKEKLGLTFLLVTHNPDLVQLGDYILQMKDGQLIQPYN
ncbi:ABC transporter ATP-binding protein [Melioribacteraceae bacterium 4301-Me]|uniref:ABC transporter ATP-binding protein n=1 Tax=Pyranulibacter aquaticus TaxID=3163344 RepID=UPI00359681DC